jgi:hypothetical protein
MLQGNVIYDHWIDAAAFASASQQSMQCTVCLLHTLAGSLDSLRGVSRAGVGQRTADESFTRIFCLFWRFAVQPHTLCAGLQATCPSPVSAGETRRICSAKVAATLVICMMPQHRTHVFPTERRSQQLTQQPSVVYGTQWPSPLSTASIPC